MYLRKKTKQKDKDRRNEQEQFLPAIVKQQEVALSTQPTQSIRSIELPTYYIQKETSKLLVLCKCLIAVAIAIAIVAELGIYVLNAYRQNGHVLTLLLAEVEKWIPVCRDIYCYLFLLGLPAIGKHRWRDGRYFSSVSTWIVVVFLFYYGLLINAQWNSVVSTDT